MLRGAYCTVNPLSKLIILISLLFSFLLFSSLVGILVLVPFYGSGVAALLSSPDFTDPSVINALKVLQILNMAGGLLLSALLYLWLCNPPKETFVAFKKPISTVVILLSALLIVLAQPLIGQANELNSMLRLPEWLSFVENWMKSAEKQGELITEAFLSTTSIPGLAVNIFMIAVLPAFAEEVLFRGALARLLKDWTKNVHLAVFLSACIFAAIHLQFYGFLPRFLLGAALGYLFFWSGSLWLPIVAHFTNNMLSITVEFLFRKGIIHTNADNFGMDNAAWLIIISILSVTGLLYLIYDATSGKQKVENYNA
jgi:membrane protease YdiL (CAAX protease family)